MPLPNGDIITKPFAYWDEYHQSFIQPIDYVQCISFALQTGVFFLLQCFWHYLSNTVARRSFMGSWEFRFYIVWAVCSMAMFPILQWRFNEDQYKSEAVPQLAYGLEVLITAVLGVRSHFRFTRILNATRERKIIHRLEYFRDMNVILTIILFIYGTCLVILCVDGLTAEKPINSHKFGTDLLIVNCNMCIIFLWIAFISIFHPRRTYTKDATSQLATDEEEMVSRNGRVTKFVMQNATKRYNDHGDEPTGTTSEYRMPSYYINPESNAPQSSVHDPMPDNHYRA
ncbi:hypothetical protein K492DRAFT_132607 [Lichtheimia hyalospora FSU 10163]|nr:hypothetical protein K492DRAFT_132607 [Lichtheimia hyalospora FSU 10163]